MFGIMSVSSESHVLSITKQSHNEEGRAIGATAPGDTFGAAFSATSVPKTLIHDCLK